MTALPVPMELIFHFIISVFQLFEISSSISWREKDKRV